MADDYLIKAMFVSNNIASVFDEEDVCATWMQEFQKAVEKHLPDLVMLHCQEVGGLTFTGASDTIQSFVEQILKLPSLKSYNRASVFIDHNYEATSEYTALGCIYLIHQRIVEASMWNFQEECFQPLSGRDCIILTKALQRPPYYRMQRFPDNLYPFTKWTRKGYIWSRWQINGMAMDLVNIHLFHDASNLVAMDATPSCYSASRKNALEWTFRQLRTKMLPEVPLAMYGDFNFRLDLCSIAKSVREKCADVIESRAVDGYLKELTYTKPEEEDAKIEKNSLPLLQIGDTLFDAGEDHKSFLTNPGQWIKYDVELAQFQNIFFEFPISFPPSYNYSSEKSCDCPFSRRRVPSWCDRILLSPSFRSHIAQEQNLHPEYGLLADNVNIGDHKPVFLCLHLRQTPGDESCS